jgi:putative lipoic acid-binding regulatory protein
MKSKEFYIQLKATLEETTTFPTKYLYKFIVPTIGTGVTDIENIFNHMGAVIDTKKSGKGTYTAVSILVQINSADTVIKKYKEVAKVKGVISL